MIGIIQTWKTLSKCDQKMLSERDNRGCDEEGTKSSFLKFFSF